jgi:DNA-binding transcriptional regulator YbjK
MWYICTTELVRPYQPISGMPRRPRRPAPPPRGAARRLALLESTIAVVAERGVGAATHRAVAEHAGVPLAATTYYFASRAELLLAAFRHLTEGRMHALDEAIAACPPRMSAELAAALWAHALAEVLRVDRARVVAEFEMHLDASRTPELREIHLAWEAKAMAYFTTGMRALGSPHPEADAALVLAVLTGLEIGELADPTADLERVLAGPLLRRLLHALVPER